MRVRFIQVLLLLGLADSLSGISSTTIPQTPPTAPGAVPKGGIDWPQWRGPTRSGVWTETGIRADLPPKFAPRWTAPIRSGYSSPTIALGRVFVMDRIDEPEERERVHCLAWDTGAPQWSFSYPAPYKQVNYKAGPRCAVLVSEGLAFALGTMGHLHCFDAKTGAVRWKCDLANTYNVRMPIWGIAASPLIEGGRLIVPACGAQAGLVAFDPATGRELWTALADRGNYAAPIVVDQAGHRVLIHRTGDRVVGLDPTSGKEHWAYPAPSKRMPLAVATPVLHRDLLFLTGFYDGCLLLRLRSDRLAVEKVWARRGRNERATDGLHSIISTPEIRGEHIYGVDSYGEFRCLKLADGARVWEDRTAIPRSRWATMHFVRHGPKTWIFTERGELILATLSPKGFAQHARTRLIPPTRGQLNRRGGVCWSHPAFAYGHVFVRNDESLACFDLRAASASPLPSGSPASSTASPATSEQGVKKGPRRDGATAEATARDAFAANVVYRGARPNFTLRLARPRAKQEPIHVAFLGGSITEMEGYRPRVCAALSKRFPSAKFRFTNAGIASTCSTTGAFRLPRDVLSKGPVDLLFVEFAVNDDQDAGHDRAACLRGMEGIVRQVRRHNPAADVVMLHFVNPKIRNALTKGLPVVSIRAHEEVAVRYGLSTIHVAKEVADRIAAGALTWKAFGGTHPGPVGNDLAAAMVGAWLNRGLRKNARPRQPLPKPLRADNFADGFLLPPSSARSSDGGFRVKRPIWNDLPGRTRPRFRNVDLLCGDVPNAGFTLPFAGSAIGAYLVAGPDAGTLEVRVDDGAWQRFDLRHRHSRGLHYPRTVMFATDLGVGKHQLEARILGTKRTGNAVRILGFAAQSDR